MSLFRCASVFTPLKTSPSACFTPSNNQFVRLASKKAGGSTKNGRDSQSKRLGVKKFGGQYVYPGNILIRQRGTKVHPSRGVKMGRDHTIFAVQEGYVRFWYDQPKKHQTISVKPTLLPQYTKAANIAKHAHKNRQQLYLRNA